MNHSYDIGTLLTSICITWIN